MKIEGTGWIWRIEETPAKANLKGESQDPTVSVELAMEMTYERAKVAFAEWGNGSPLEGRCKITVESE